MVMVMVRVGSDLRAERGGKWWVGSVVDTDFCLEATVERLNGFVEVI